MKDATTFDGLSSYESALGCLPAMSRGELGPHWSEWHTQLGQARYADSETVAAMRPLTEQEEDWLWEAYHQAAALSHEASTSMAVGGPQGSIFEVGLPWLLKQEKISWPRLSRRWMSEASPPNQPTDRPYKWRPTRPISKEERVAGFHVLLGLTLARENLSGSAPLTSDAVLLREMREHLIARMDYAPESNGWRNIVLARSMWSWPEMLSSPAYAYARTQPLDEPLALGGSLTRGDLFGPVIGNPLCVPGTRAYHMVLEDVSPPTTLDLEAWNDWADYICAAGDDQPAPQVAMIEHSLWEIIRDRLVRSNTVPAIQAARLLRSVLKSITPSAPAYVWLSAWWDEHREVLRTQPALPESAQVNSPIGELLLEASPLSETPDWASRYASEEMTRSQTENVLRSISYRSWARVEDVILAWARQEKHASILDPTLSLLDVRIDCTMARPAQWLEVYTAQRAAGHSAGWVIGWLAKGRLSQTVLPPSLLRQLLQAPDREVREYAIRSMAQSRATQNTPVTEPAPTRSVS